VGIPRYAVIPTHNRHEQLAQVITQLELQCSHIIVIDNASEPPVVNHREHVTLIRDDEQPPNLSRLWNVGIDLAARFAVSEDAGCWDVAIVNDDAVIRPGWWYAVSTAMRARSAAAGSSDPFQSLPMNSVVTYGANAPMGVATRLTGWAFILRGEYGIRADERLRWWYGDDLISLHARQAGGIVHVGGYPVANLYANLSTNGALAEQAARDRAMFVELTGREPW
jgi:hypothetical protein